MKDEKTAVFKSHFEGEPRVYRSPGRINFLGEHTDYNGGFVLPAAIDKAIYVAVAPREDDQINLYAEDYDEKFSTTLDEVKPGPQGAWSNYVLGVVDQIKQRGKELKGFDMSIGGDVPLGAGLSSSAALECATAFALNDIFDLGFEKIDLIKMAQKAEHTYAGVMCGIMDQFASVMGKKDHAVKLDCRSLEYEHVPLKMDGLKVVLLNTNVKHSLASSEYNTRRAQCEKGVALVKEHHPEVETLRDVTQEMLDKYVKDADPEVYKRCHYVVGEAERILEAKEHLKHGEMEALGELMYQTHDGLSKEYEVSCKELDYLVDFVRDNPNVLGARMMGGGFGGCTINIVKEEGIDELVASASEAYERDMGKPLTAYVVSVEDGSEQLN